MSEITIDTAVHARLIALKGRSCPTTRRSLSCRTSVPHMDHTLSTIAATRSHADTHSARRTLAFVSQNTCRFTSRCTTLSMRFWGGQSPSFSMISRCAWIRAIRRCVAVEVHPAATATAKTDTDSEASCNHMPSNVAATRERRRRIR